MTEDERIERLAEALRRHAHPAVEAVLPWADCREPYRDRYRARAREVAAAVADAGLRIAEGADGA